VRHIHQSVVSPIVVNWHVTEACNFRCQYCYAKWQQPNSKELIRNVDATTALIEALHTGFAKLSASGPPRLNFAGGEPLLYASQVTMAMKKACAIGFDVSLITNGSRLTTEVAERIAPHLTMLGISIDATTPATNKRIGRLDRRGAYLDLAGLIDRIALMLHINPSMTLKINTVVNEANWQDDLSPLIASLAPARWKVLRMLPAVTDALALNDEQFQAFVNRHRALNNIMCIEDNDDMVQSYIMVDPYGRFFQNRISGGGYDNTPPIIDVGALEAFDRMNWLAEKFASRYPRISIRRAA
jgi:radical S-adenosyl methionine domain-containing protein 2